MRGIAEYLAACILIAAIASGLCAAFLRRPAADAVMVSAAVAVGVQGAAFLVARAFRARNLMLGWGLGSALRLIALLIYGLGVARLERALMAPALLSFTVLLFVMTVVEPVFLKR